MDLSRFALVDIISVICSAIDIDSLQLQSSFPGWSAKVAKSLVVYYAYYFGGYSLVSIALFLKSDVQALIELMHQMLSDEQGAQIGEYMRKIEQDFWYRLIEINLAERD
jgi:hypothetical protein